MPIAIVHARGTERAARLRELKSYLPFGAGKVKVGRKGVIEITVDYPYEELSQMIRHTRDRCREHGYEVLRVIGDA